MKEFQSYNMTSASQVIEKTNFTLWSFCFIDCARKSSLYCKTRLKFNSAYAFKQTPVAKISHV